MGTQAITPEVLAARAGFDKSVHCDLCWRKRKAVIPAAGMWGSILYCNTCRISDRVPQNEWTPVEALSPPMAGVTTMSKATPAARAAMGKANPVHPLEPSESAEEIRREVLWGHKGLKAAKAGPKTVAAIRVRTPAAPAVDPDAPERVQISVNAAYLDHFWQGRSTAEKARMVSNFFAEAGV